MQTVANRKKFFSFYISEIPNFSCVFFFRKCSMFRRSIPLRIEYFSGPRDPQKMHSLKLIVVSGSIKKLFQLDYVNI